jgi:hypothetical protein
MVDNAMIRKTTILIITAEIHFPEHGRRHAGLIEPSRPRHLGPIQRKTDHPGSDLMHVLPGDKTHPARGAYRTVAVRPRKMSAFFGQPVQVRSLYIRMAAVSGHQRMMLITTDDQKIFRGRGHFLLLNYDL